MKKLAAMAVLVLAMIVTACSSSVSPDVQQVCDLITGQAESVAKVTDTDKMFALTTSDLEKLGKYSDNKTELTDADREALREAYRKLAEASVAGVVSANPGVLSEDNKADYVEAALTVVNDNVSKAKTLGEAVRVM